MSSETLYRKYRSKDFGEVIGQEHITKTLLNSIKNSTFAHAYLLTGPRGVGKTSVARLFACKINGVNYGDGQTYSDIIEIDAASNRRIDEIRELRDKVNIAPSALKYKVYIIDEVHMLTKEAFNALLKTLEEPPEHVVFILATTDFHKVPDTITSRCIRFAFMPISKSSIKQHLSKIAKQESINIDEEAISIIADNAEGSFRDAISLLDQFRNSSETIKADYVARVLGMSPEAEITRLLEYAAKSEPKNIVDSLDEIRDSGSSDGQIIKQLIGQLRAFLIRGENSKMSKSQAIKLIENLLKIDGYSNKKIALEIALIEACEEEGEPKNPKTPATEAKIPEMTQKISKEETIPPEPKESIPGETNLWDSVLEELKANHSTLYAVARMAEPKLDGSVLDLYFKFPFHYKQMKLEKNLLQLEKTVGSLDKSIEKVNVFQKKPEDNETDHKQKNKQPVKNISNIFGPSEVLES